jgi:hypothetical protein
MGLRCFSAAEAAVSHSFRFAGELENDLTYDLNVANVTPLSKRWLWDINVSRGSRVAAGGWRRSWQCYDNRRSENAGHFETFRDIRAGRGGRALGGDDGSFFIVQNHSNRSKPSFLERNRGRGGEDRSCLTEGIGHIPFTPDISSDL